MAKSSSFVCCRGPSMQTVNPHDKLLLFGYSCKIFRDEEKSEYIEKGKHLIPWMGDETLMIDRYDARGYLHDDLKQYEPKSKAFSDDPLSEEEKLCDDERYRSLRSDMSEEELYQEEELKRLHAAVASDGAYNEIGFSYDNEVEKQDEPMGPKVEEPEDEPYKAPASLNVPKGMETPFNMKIHAIIEKTALFVSEQGGQMEIIIKVKQHANPQFGFMHLDNSLYPYYKHLVEEINSGSYKPVQPEKVSQSDDEDDDGHYLHPSLLSGKKENVPMFTVPSISFRRSHDDSYSVLVRNVQQQLAEEKSLEEQPVEDGGGDDDGDSSAEKQCLVNYSLNETFGSTGTPNTSYTTPFVIPPTEIQPIIQKMAEYVAQNGEDFESVVKSKNDKRFDFLQPSSEYYSYYKHIREGVKQRLEAPPIATENADLISTHEQPGTHENNVNIEPSEMETETVIPSQNHKDQEIVAQPAIGEFDSLYFQNSQDVVLGTEASTLEVSKEEQTTSTDSVGLSTDTRAKTSKILKGPISFSLKVKDSDTAPCEKLEVAMLLDDSDGDSSSSEEAKEKNKSHRRKSTQEHRSVSNSSHDSMEREEKVKSSTEIDAKLAKECMKDKLLSAARKRLLQKKERQFQMEHQKREEQLKKEKQLQIEQQKKGKQLQLERKKKAALFLKMLTAKDPGSDLVGRLGNDTNSESDKPKKDFRNLAEGAGSDPENGILFPVSKLHISTNNGSLSIPGINTAWSSSTVSEESGDEIMITEFCSEPDPAPELIVPIPKKVSKPENHEHKKRKKKHYRSKSRDHLSKSSRVRDRSRSPKNYKHEKSRKEKELPAAYALVSRHISTNDGSPSIPDINTAWSSSTVSEESGEEIMITEFCSEPDSAPELIPEKVSKPEKHEHKKKKKKHSRSKSRDHRSKSSRIRDRHRSRSPKNYKHEKSRKEKKLPAAYALVSRSRSRSRSPRRYRQNADRTWNYNRRR